MSTDRPTVEAYLDDLGDAELIASWREAEPAAKNAVAALRVHEHEILRRMSDRLALESEIGTVVRSPQLGPYQWQPDALHALFGDRLTAAMWAEIEVTVSEVKFRTVAINKYAKRLGVSDAELRSCYFRAESRQELEFVPFE